MSLRAVALVLLVITPLAAPPSAHAQPETRERVAALIEQLGSVKYVERREAQRELAGIGLAAFDQLYAATSHEDPEVAAASTRLLTGMTVRWAQPGDSAAVRASLDLFGRMDEEERGRAVVELATLPERDGLSALCRIARFDLSPAVAARAAAVAMAQDAWEVDDEKRREVAACLTELDEVYGPSRREPPTWLRWYAEEHEDAPAEAERWADEVARLRALDKRNDAAVDTAVIEALAWNLLRAQLRAGRQPEAAENVERLLASTPASAAAVTARALEWMLAADADEAIDRLLAGENEHLTGKRGLYLAADTRFKQGREEEAQRLADKALEAAPNPGDAIVQNGEVLIDARVLVGNMLREAGRADWALREYRRAIEQVGPLSSDAAYAGVQVSDVLQDREDYVQAAAALGELIGAIDESDSSRRAYGRQAERKQMLGLPPLSVLRAREAYYRALGHRKSGDVAAEHAALLEAYEHDPTDADIVIALYRATDADEKLRAKAADAVHELADQIEMQLDQDPSSAMPYNQWAWLISNTEGDYDKALRYSKRSLRLRPGDPGYLDTLGRCYYAVGDVEKAVQTQREAVRKAPYFKVMQRQLELFEEVLARQRDGQPRRDPEASSATDAE